MRKPSVTSSVLTALFCALIIAGTFIRIPIPPVPVTLQTLFVYLAVLILGPLEGTLCLSVYLFLGLAGLPVFTAGGGPAALFGPTGGFLFAMLLGAPLAGLIAFISGNRPIWWLDALALLLYTFLIYLGGTLWFMFRLPGYTLTQTLAVTCLPFLPGDALKIVLAVILSGRLRPSVAQSLADRDC